jgi:hypothetical protein
MKSNSQTQLSPRLYLGDVDGDKSDEFIEVDGRHLYVFRANSQLNPVLEHVFALPDKRLIIGDFVSSGREHGKDQICAILSDGSLQAFAISDDLKSLCWWFTQPNFIGDDEHSIVGDFDGDGADDLLVYKPSTGALSMYTKLGTGVFGEMPYFSLGNLSGFNLVNKQISAGEFGQASGRKDIIVVDKIGGQIIRFDSVTDVAGNKTFWWAFTTKTNLFGESDQVCVANVSGCALDGIIIRDFNTGLYSIYNASFDRDSLQSSLDTTVGQLSLKPRAGNIVAAKVRDNAFRLEPGGESRDDILFFDESTGELICADARFDAIQSKFTYWWSYSLNLLFEPNISTSCLPWAIILCRFKGLPGDPAIEKFFREIFTPGSGGMVEYWHDASLGSVDISTSRIFGWIELDLERKDAGGVYRSTLIDAAIAAARRDGLEPVNGFHSQIAVFTHNWSKDGAPPGVDWSDPVWGPFWIDGSSANGRVSSPPREHNGTFLAHEMGHGFGFSHDVGADLTSEYGDRNCIMSAMIVNDFIHPPWNVEFGPSMSFPQLMLKNWMYQRRVLRVSSNWTDDASGVNFLLASINDRTANANLGVVLPNSTISKWDYYLEFMAPTGWNKGINSKLVIRRLTPGGASAYLGKINLPTMMTDPANEWNEPSGNIHFKVERIQADGRVMKVTATKSSSCPVTTACMASRGLGDDCEELKTLRLFRDTYVSKLPEGKKLIDEYYEVAPQLVNNINHTENAHQVYEMIYQKYIWPITSHLLNQEYEKALLLSQQAVKSLKRDFLITN